MYACLYTELADGSQLNHLEQWLNWCDTLLRQELCRMRCGAFRLYYLDDTQMLALWRGVNEIFFVKPEHREKIETDLCALFHHMFPGVDYFQFALRKDPTTFDGPTPHLPEELLKDVKKKTENLDATTAMGQKSMMGKRKDESSDQENSDDEESDDVSDNGTKHRCWSEVWIVAVRPVQGKQNLTLLTPVRLTGGLHEVVVYLEESIAEAFYESIRSLYSREDQEAHMAAFDLFKPKLSVASDASGGNSRKGSRKDSVAMRAYGSTSSRRGTGVSRKSSMLNWQKERRGSQDLQRRMSGERGSLGRNRKQSTVDKLDRYNRKGSTVTGRERHGSTIDGRRNSNVHMLEKARQGSVLGGKRKGLFGTALSRGSLEPTFETLQEEDEEEGQRDPPEEKERRHSLVIVTEERNPMIKTSIESEDHGEEGKEEEEKNEPLPTYARKLSFAPAVLKQQRKKDSMTSSPSSPTGGKSPKSVNKHKNRIVGAGGMPLFAVPGGFENGYVASVLGTKYEQPDPEKPDPALATVVDMKEPAPKQEGDGVPAFSTTEREFSQTAMAVPEHAWLTAMRIAWTVGVKCAITLGSGSALGRCVLREFAFIATADRKSCLLPLLIELRELLDRATRERTRLSNVQFLHLGWTDWEAIAVGLGELRLHFGFELYGPPNLHCPVSERSFLQVTQSLGSYKASLLRGDLATDVSTSFAAAAGIAVVQVHLSEHSLLEPLCRHLLGSGCSGHWAFLHGVDAIREDILNNLLKYLARFFFQLKASVQLMSGRLMGQSGPRAFTIGGAPRGSGGGGAESRSNAGSVGGLAGLDAESLAILQGAAGGESPSSSNANAAPTMSFRDFWDFPPEEIQVRRTPCEIDYSNIEPAEAYYKFGKPQKDPKTGVKSNHRQPHDSVTVPADGDSDLISVVSDTTNATGTESSDDSSDLSVGSRGVITAHLPMIMHPASAVFVVPAGSGRGIESFIFRVTSFPKPADLALVIKVMLLRTGIEVPSGAYSLHRALSTFNSYAVQRSDIDTPLLAIGDARVVCQLAGALRTSRLRVNPLLTIDEMLLLIEAWIVGIGGRLDASTERELLWHCTELAFGGTESFRENEQELRYMLVSESFGSQRHIKKDVNARFCDDVAAKFKAEFSFFNSLLVTKCMLMMNALRDSANHLAIVGMAGVGKSTCLRTVSQAGRTFCVDDETTPLFHGVRQVTLNTLAYDPRRLLEIVPRLAKNCGTGASEKDWTKTWVVLDGPLRPSFLSLLTSPSAWNQVDGYHFVRNKTMSVVFETDHLCDLTPSCISSLHVVFIDSNQGITWKDRIVAWGHRFKISNETLAPVIDSIVELVVNLMDKLLTFMLYYFFADSNEQGKTSSGLGQQEGMVPRKLDHIRQAESFLSLFTSFLLEPSSQRKLLEVTKEGQVYDHGKEKNENFEEYVRILVAMSAVNAAGGCLLTHQRTRFEKFLREQILPPKAAENFSPLYDLYYDSKTEMFQAVHELVRLSDPILDDNHICVATEEFVAFQLRLRRLIAVGAHVLLAGTAGSGKTTLLRYLRRSPFTALNFALLPVAAETSADSLLDIVLSHTRISSRHSFSPSDGKRFILLVDDLHLSVGASSYSIDSSEKAANTYGDGGLSDGARMARQENISGDRTRTSSALTEWMRFQLENHGFYDNRQCFMSVRNVTFLPALLSPEASVPFCQRFSRHFHVAFMEKPGIASVKKIFSTVLSMQLSPVFRHHTTLFADTYQDDLGECGADAAGAQVLVDILLETTLEVYHSVEILEDRRMHGLARVFWDLAHTFSMAKPESIGTLKDIGTLWAYVMRTFVVDALIVRLSEIPKFRRRAVNAISVFAQTVFGQQFTFSDLEAEKQGDYGDPKPGQVDMFCYATFNPLLALEDRRAGAQVFKEDLPPLVIEKVPLEQARDHVLRTLGLDMSVNNDPKTKRTVSDIYLDNDALDPRLLVAWLSDNSAFCALLRLCHTLALHPLVCVIGAWAHLPLLYLAARLFGTELVLASDGGESLLEQLQPGCIDPIPPPAHEAMGMTSTATTPKAGNKRSSLKRQSVGRAGRAARTLTNAAHDQALHASRLPSLVLVDETRLRAQCTASFVRAQRAQFFGRASHYRPIPEDDEDEDDVNTGRRGSLKRISVENMADESRRESNKSRISRMGSGLASATSYDSVRAMAEKAVQQAQLNQTDVRQEEKRSTCLVVACQSASSFRGLAMRCVSIQEFLSAAVMFTPRMSLSRVATSFLQGNLPPEFFPKDEKKHVKPMDEPVMLFARKNKRVPDSPGGTGSSNMKKSMAAAQALQKDNVEPKKSKKKSDGPQLGYLGDTVDHVRQNIENVISKYYDVRFARGFCSPVRFFRMLSILSNLAQKWADYANHRRKILQGVLQTCTDAENQKASLVSTLRALRVTLSKLQTDVRQYTREVTHYKGKQQEVAVIVQEILDRRTEIAIVLQSVDRTYEPAFLAAQGNMDVAFRDIERLPVSTYGHLGHFLHPPEQVLAVVDLCYLLVFYQEFPEDPEVFCKHFFTFSNIFSTFLFFCVCFPVYR